MTPQRHFVILRVQNVLLSVRHQFRKIGGTTYYLDWSGKMVHMLQTDKVFPGSPSNAFRPKNLILTTNHAANAGRLPLFSAIVEKGIAENVTFALGKVTDILHRCKKNAPKDLLHAIDRICVDVDHGIWTPTISMLFGAGYNVSVYNKEMVQKFASNTYDPTILSLQICKYHAQNILFCKLQKIKGNLKPGIKGALMIWLLQFQRQVVYGLPWQEDRHLTFKVITAYLATMLILLTAPVLKEYAAGITEDSVDVWETMHYSISKKEKENKLLDHDEEYGTAGINAAMEYCRKCVHSQRDREPEPQSFYTDCAHCKTMFGIDAVALDGFKRGTTISVYCPDCNFLNRWFYPEYSNILDIPIKCAKSDTLLDYIRIAEAPKHEENGQVAIWKYSLQVTCIPYKWQWQRRGTERMTIDQILAGNPIAESVSRFVGLDEVSNLDAIWNFWGLMPMLAPSLQKMSFADPDGARNNDTNLPVETDNREFKRHGTQSLMNHLHYVHQQQEAQYTVVNAATSGGKFNISKLTCCVSHLLHLNCFLQRFIVLHALLRRFAGFTSEI